MTSLLPYHRIQRFAHTWELHLLMLRRLKDRYVLRYRRLVSLWSSHQSSATLFGVPFIHVWHELAVIQRSVGPVVPWSRRKDNECRAKARHGLRLSINALYIYRNYRIFSRTIACLALDDIICNGDVSWPRKYVKITRLHTIFISPLYYCVYSARFMRGQHL